MASKSEKTHKAQRSAIMRAVKSRGNKSTELTFLNILRAHHISGWRRGSRLEGKPDFVFPSAKLAVFIDGCFWHGCPTHCRRPASSRAYWEKKLSANMARDTRVSRNLKLLGWRVIRIWEHELNRGCMRRVHQLQAALKKTAS